MYRSRREERPRRHSPSPVRRDRLDDHPREYERASRRSRSRDRGPSRRRTERSRSRSRSRDRGYDHSYARGERDREAEYDQYAAFGGGYGYAGYGVYPAASYGVQVPGLLGDSCFVCGGIGHIALDCPSRETLQRGRAGFPRMSREREADKCFECGKQGHQAREVRRKHGERGCRLRCMLGSAKSCCDWRNGRGCSLQGVSVSYSRSE